MTQYRSKWLNFTDQLLGPLIGAAGHTLSRAEPEDVHLRAIPYCAVVHLASSVQTSMWANRKGYHAVAIGLTRHCVEALTLVDVGLQDWTYAEPLLAGWDSGKLSQGELRASLERDAWPRYGRGLWMEPWAEFFGNLARAVQLYAHYTPQLMGWQFADINGLRGETFVVAIGANSYDPLKASRITLLHALTGWALGRLLLAQRENSDVRAFSGDILRWEKALGASKLLFKTKDWAIELMPHMFFDPVSDWHER